MKNEGYLLIDHRASPGITADFIRQCGHNPADFPVVGEGQVYEAATKTCSHCQKVVIMSPTRKRERATCHKCGRYICDSCSGALFQTGECRMVRATLDRLQEKIARQEQATGTAFNGTIILP